MNRGSAYWKTVAGQIVILAVFLGLVEYVVRQGIVSNLYLASPSQVAGELADLVRKNLLFRHLSITLVEFFLGYGAAIVLGIGTALFLVLTPRAEDMLKPFFSALMAIPKVTIIPLMILWLGIGVLNKTAIVFVFSFFPILFNTIAGIGQTDEHLLKVARVLGARRLQTIRMVILPSAVPTIFSGMRLAAGTGLVGALFGEMLASKGGLGNLLVRATELYNTAQAFAIIVVVTLVSVLIVLAIDILERKVFWKWKSS
ncbi:MAG: ABC transporter permease [Syntrophales bacterium]|nr:ABC transporter permease [Syntrophales bacterium]